MPICIQLAFYITVGLLQAEVDETIIELQRMQQQREDAENKASKLEEETARLKKATLETRYALCTDSCDSS